MPTTISSLHAFNMRSKKGEREEEQEKGVKRREERDRGRVGEVG
jgi:hypothetical protein